MKKHLHTAGGMSSGGTRTDRPPDDNPKRASQARSAFLFFASTKPITSNSIETDEKPCPLTVGG
ncbi:MAG: hypothetical protein GQ567_04790 [Methanosarcinales archaeon]|nr:hypothetical protein [Methanosarcinales archaeon]